MNENKLTKKQLIIQLLAIITIFIINGLIAVLICKHFGIYNHVIIGYGLSAFTPITYETIIFLVLTVIDIIIAYLFLPKKWLD